MNKVELLRSWLLTRDGDTFSLIHDWLQHKIALYIRYHAKVPRREVEDVVQEVLIQLVQLPSIATEQPLGFVSVVVRNHALNVYRRLLRITPMTDLPEGETPISPEFYIWDGEPVIDREHVKTKLRPVASRISRLTYKCLRMRARGHSWQRVAQRCGITVHVARNHVARAENYLPLLAA